MEIKNFFKKTVDNNNNEVYNLDDTFGRDDAVLVKVLLENDVKRFTITDESTGTLRRIVLFMEAGFKVTGSAKVVIGKDVHQKGSNITPERMRFDFSCDHKLSEEEKQKVEDLVNEWIKESIPVTVEEMKKEDAIKSGAECMFIEKYPDIVTVYSIGNDKETVSKELCGGPHVKNTSELGHFVLATLGATAASN